MFENFDECMNELVSIVNNARAIQQSVTDYGLTYVYRNLTSCFELVTGIRKEVEGTGRLEFLALGEQLDERQPSWRMRFEEEYDIVKYIFFVIYGIELGNIFERDISEVQNGKISFLNSNIKETLTLQLGDVLGIYGQNGSGKTTLFKTLSILEFLPPS